MSKEFLPTTPAYFHFSKEEKGALIVLDRENANMFEFFSDENIEKILEELESSAQNLSSDLDASSVANRKSLKSIAYRFRTTKTALDDAGKDFLAGFKKKAKEIDGGRKKLKEGIDKIVSDILADVTAFEEREASRIAGHTKNLEELRILQAKIENADRESLAVIQKDVAGFNESDFEEFTPQSEKLFASIKENLNSRSAALDAAEERERLAKIENERIKKERDEALKRQAREEARKEAEAKAAAEREAAEKEKAAALEAVRKEAEAKAVAEREAAEKEKAAALEAVRKEAEAKAAAEREAAEKEKATALEAVRKEAEAKAAAEREAAEKEKALSKKLGNFPSILDREKAEQAVLTELKRFLSYKDACDILQIISADMIPYLRIVNEK